jgi:plastocyanin
MAATRAGRIGSRVVGGTLAPVQEWWVFLHVAAVLAFVATHGASIVMLFRLRKERDPAKVNDFLQLSAASSRGMYVSLIAVVVTGAIAAFTGHWWGYGWVWGALGILALTTFAMVFMAKPYYQRVGTIARAMAGGSKAVTPEQFEQVLREPRPWSVAGIGVVALAALLYLMLFKPSLGLQPTAAPLPTASGTSLPCSPAGTTVNVSGHDTAFDQSCLAAQANTPFTIAFDNQQGTHNVAIYTDNTASKVLFRGDLVTGPRTVNYSVPAMQKGTYFFRCDVHPTQMTGVFVVAAP